MLKATFNTVKIAKKTNRKIENVTSISFSNNHKTDKAFISINGKHIRELPTAQLVGFTSVPLPWSITSNIPFDIEFEVTFENAVGDLYVDFIQVKC